MAAPGWEDLSPFFAEFAVSVTLTQQSGDTRQIAGIFDDPYLDAQIGEYELDSRRPRLLCRLTDLAGTRRGDTVTIDGIIYDVLTSPQPDGTGLGTLSLAPRQTEPA